jgi:histidyl-tRNA synthetase
MRDLLPEDAERMRNVEQVSRKISKLFGYSEIITPVLEPYGLIAAKTSEEIRDRMYTFKDLGDRKVAMRPEFTASVARLVVNRFRNEPKPMRLFSVGSLYRYDEPQYGRFREFWQANYELFGSSRPEADAEILMLTNDFLKMLGLKEYQFKVGHAGILKGILNHEGLVEEKQNKVRQLLDKKLWTNALLFARDIGVSDKGLDTLERLFKIEDQDPFQSLSKIKDIMEEYPSAMDALDNLWKILDLLTETDDQLKILIKAGFARGLEYYTGLIFESYLPGFDIALGGGGRYDKLISLFGGESIPAVGVAQGIDRIVLAQKKQRDSFNPKKIDVMIFSIKDECMKEVLKISSNLRKKDLSVNVGVMGRNIRNALADANRRSVRFVVIVGPNELKEGKVVLREMEQGSQKSVKIANLVEEIFSSS